RRLQSRRRDEPEIALPEFFHPCRQVCSESCRWHILGRFLNHIQTRCFQPALKLRLGQLLTLVDYLEETPQGLAKALAVSLGRAVRQRRQILHLPDQMSHTELQPDVELA